MIRLGMPRPARQRATAIVREMIARGPAAITSREIADKAGCSHFTAQEALRDLVARGTLSYERSGTGKKWRRREYSIDGSNK